MRTWISRRGNGKNTLVNHTIETLWWNQEVVSDSLPLLLLLQKKKKKKSCSLRSHFVIWDQTRTIMAYWPSSVSMGTEKPFLSLLRLESYLLLFYFGIADADYQEAHWCYSNSYYLSHSIYLWYHYSTPLLLNFQSCSVRHYFVCELMFEIAKRSCDSCHWAYLLKLLWASLKSKKIQII